MVDRIVRKSEAARLLGVSGTSLWRLEREGLLRAVSVLPGLAGFRESELQAFVESRERAEPDRARVEAALASPLHGRAGQKARSESGGERPAAPPVNVPEGKRAPLTITQTPQACPMCAGVLSDQGSGLLVCADSFALSCDWAARVEGARDAS